MPITQKRTYSRRNMTMVPTNLSASPEHTGTSKRRKAGLKDEARTEARSMSSGKSTRQKQPSKKFGGPVSIPYDEMDVDEDRPAQVSSKDPFTRVLNEYKATSGT
jgi:hypothetical protein